MLHLAIKENLSRKFGYYSIIITLKYPNKYQCVYLSTCLIVRRLMGLRIMLRLLFLPLTVLFILPVGRLLLAG